MIINVFCQYPEDEPERMIHETAPSVDGGYSKYQYI